MLAAIMPAAASVIAGSWWPVAGAPTVDTMRFRRREWDVAMPDALVSYWTAWNEPELERIRQHLISAVTADVEWNDPRDSFRGITELEAAIKCLRTSKPDYRFVITSEVDHHHDRFRYRWDMVRNDRTLMEGLDVVTLEPSLGLIARVDGFFGHPTPIDHDESGVPRSLRSAPIEAADRQ